MFPKKIMQACLITKRSIILQNSLGGDFILDFMDDLGVLDEAMWVG